MKIPVYDSMDLVKEWQLCHDHRATDPEMLKEIAEMKTKPIPVRYERGKKHDIEF